LAQGVPRSTAWGKVPTRAIPSLSWLLYSFKREIRLLEALRAAKRVSPYREEGPTVKSSPRPLSGPYTRFREGPVTCKYCSTPHKHRMHRMATRAYALKSWRGYTPEMKLARMEKAWAGRRRRKNTAILSAVDPRIRKILGDKEILKRYGR